METLKWIKDKMLENLMSKKFWLLIAATILLWFGKISDIQWNVVAGLYIAANVAQKRILNNGIPDSGITEQQNGGTDNWVDGSESDEMPEEDKIGFKKVT